MRFPNAAKGVKKIFTAEILKLISYICLIAAALFVIGVIASTNIDQIESDDIASVLNGLPAGVIGGFFGAIGLALIFGILLAVAFVVNLLGCINARHDDENFKTALFFLIVSVVFAIASVFVMSNGFGSILYSLATLSDTLATIFVIAGGVRLADQLNRGDISKKGTNVLKLIIVIEAISFVAGFITTFLRGSATMVAAIILFMATLILSFVKYIMYLSFLSKTKKMLNES